MKLAILGWGSLLWDGHQEFDDWHSPWESEGPPLKIEFSRISGSRLGALTLVVDEEHGVPMRVSWCMSLRTEPDEVAEDLRFRESTTAGNIARLVVAEATGPWRGSPTSNLVLEWARAQAFDAVFWTALKNNFAECTKQSFSVEAAVAYVERLAPEARAKAIEYVHKAPAFVLTPVRTALGREPWFREAREQLI